MTGTPPPPDSNPDTPTRGDPVPPEPEPRGRNRTGMLIASGLVLVGLIVGVALILAAISDDDPDPASVTDVEADESDVTTVPDVEATLSQGNARIEGESGTVSGTDADEPGTIPSGIDLTAVDLDSDGETLTVTFEVADEIPETLEEETSILWTIQTWDEDTLQYSLETRLQGSEWTVGVHSVSPNRFVELPDTPDVRGNQLTVQFPATSMPEIPEQFGWTALTEWVDEENVLTDALPPVDEDEDTEETLTTFPG